PIAREELVVEASGDAQPPWGRDLYVGVVDPSVYDAPVAFRLVVTLGRDPPAEALALPQLEVPSDPKARAVASVVEVIVADGSGSGTIVREDGLVLTARHVVGD